MKLRITSDSTCDLGHLVEERDIGIMHFMVNLGDKAYLDGKDIAPKDIFAFVKETNVLPKTSAPSIGDYEDFFTQELAGYDELVHFNLSAKASSSHNFAVEAAKSFGGKVRVIDSKALSSGQGLLVLKAADMRDEGKTGEEIENAIFELRDRTNTSFVPDALDYLHKGGRCSGMTMLAANLLKIHPKIVMVDGKLESAGKYKGNMDRCITRYIEELRASYPSYDRSRCFVTHSNAEKELVDVAKAKVAELFDFEEVIETVAGSIVTSHCGKGTLGVLFIYNK